jgi:hypothetical protein
MEKSVGMSYIFRKFDTLFFGGNKQGDFQNILKILFTFNLSDMQIFIKGS